MERVDAAEKEASEVLHSLLSVERVEKHCHELDPHHQQQVCIFGKQPSNNRCIYSRNGVPTYSIFQSDLWCNSALSSLGLAWLHLVRLGYVMPSHNGLA